MKSEEDKKAEVKPITEEHKVYLTTNEQLSRDDKGQKIINEFILQETIGKGGYSKVRKVLHGSDKAFAMKIMHKPSLRKGRELKYNPDGSSAMTNNLEKAYSEIETWSELNHENIVKIYEVIDDPNSDNLHIIMDLADFGQIANWEKEVRKYKRNEKIFDWVLENKLKDTKFESEQCKIEAVSRYVFKQIVEGVNYLHGKNIVNRDIKPDNILFVSNNGIVKITDFTVAEKLTTENDKCYNGEGTSAFSGTLYIYLAPESCETFDGYLALPTDIWSLGITLYAYIEGSIPFYDENDIKMQTNAQNNELEIPKEFSKPLVGLLKGMIEKDPLKRMTITQVKQHPWFNMKQ